MNKKRSYNASIMKTNDTMFDLSGSVFAVVSLFMGKLYVHIRVFSNNKCPTKNGISMSASQWEALMKSINRKGTNTTSGVTMGARRGEQGGAVAPPWKKKKFEKKCTN